MASSTSSNIKIPAHRKLHDVFLSFRGADTRDIFVCHLFDALCRKGIITFLDENLNRGEEISPALLQTIEESHVSVVIFSENYAHSQWCLDELEKIMECKRTMGQVVLPVFYRVDPTVVEELTGSYGDALIKHGGESTDNLVKVENWSCALKETARISGFHSKNYKHDQELIEEITKRVEDIVQHTLERLNQASSCNPCDDGLVGIESRIKEVESLLEFESTDEVRFLGIWGMAGIGKTTLASKVFDRFSSQFEGQCFIGNVREKLEKYTLDGLQHEILSKAFGKEILNVGMPIMFSSHIRKWIVRKKVLIVLDDLCDLDQLEFLIGCHVIYAPGSRIIITSRDRQILQNGRSYIYEVKELKDYESLQLFLFHALKQNPPTEAYMRLAKKAVKYARGNPLAVKVLGANLYNKSVEEWENELEKLNSISDEKIERIFRLSFDDLGANEQKMFLDIACFFNLQSIERVESVLDGCGLFARTGISRLRDKSLITILDKRLVVMHDLIQKMGHEIVCKQGKNPGERTRLWIAQDIYNVLKKEKGTISVEGISLDVTKIRDIELSSAAFLKMSNLRFLEFYSPYYPKGTSCGSYYRIDRIYDSKNGVHLPEVGLSFLPDELRYLYWFDYPAKSLPNTFCPDNLVHLHLINSQLEELCFELQCLESLKVMDLSLSIHLIKIPDLSEVPKLEFLCLRGCSSLVEIRSSIQHHSNLLYIDLGYCKNLCRFPRFVDMRNLDFLCLEGCSLIREFPEVPENIRRIILNGTAIKQVPSSIGHRSRLTTLELKSCRGLKSLPSSIGELKCLEHLNLKGCSELMILPDDICSLKSLESLDIADCQNLQGLPENLGNLESLEYLFARKSGIKKLPSSTNGLSKLKALSCYGCKGLIVPPLKNLSALESVNFGDCGMTQISSSISSLVSLQYLNLRENNLETLPTSIKVLPELRQLDLSDCKRLKSLPDLPTSLEILRVRNCASLNSLSTSPTNENTYSLMYFHVGNCPNLDHNEYKRIVDNMLLRVESILLVAKNFIESIRSSREEVYEFDTGFCIPRGEAPVRMRYQNNSGSSLQCSLRSNSDDVIVLAFWAVIASDGCYSRDRITVNCKCRFEAESGETLNFRSIWPPYRRGKQGRALDELENIFWSQATVFWVSGVSLINSFNKASFQFYTEGDEIGGSTSAKVIKCGVHILCDNNDINSYTGMKEDSPHSVSCAVYSRSRDKHIFY